MPRDAFLAHDKKIYQQTIGTQVDGTIVTIGPRKKFTISVDGKAYLGWNDGRVYQLPILLAAQYGTLAFTAPSTLTRTAGSWVTDGYDIADRTVYITGAATAANNGTFTVASATALVLTIAEATLANEAASTTERVEGTRPLEATTSDMLLPAAGAYTFRSDDNSAFIRIYNPHALNSLLATVFVAMNV